MTGKCKECGKNMQTDEIIHCSNRCLFVGIKNSKSIKGIPIEIWDEKDPTGFDHPLNMLF